MTERERFEAWASGSPRHLPVAGYEGKRWRWVYVNPKTQLAWEAWQAALKPRQTPEPSDQ